MSKLLKTRWLGLACLLSAEDQNLLTYSIIIRLLKKWILGVYWIYEEFLITTYLRPQTKIWRISVLKMYSTLNLFFLNNRINKIWNPSAHAMLPFFKPVNNALVTLQFSSLNLRSTSWLYIMCIHILNCYGLGFKLRILTLQVLFCPIVQVSQPRVYIHYPGSPELTLIQYSTL